MQQQFKQLKCDQSLKLEEDMPVIWPKQESPGRLKVSQIIKPIKGQKVYSANSKVIAFVADGELYVTPYRKDSLEILRTVGYKTREFFVPFSNGDKPLGEYGEKWRDIVAKFKPTAYQAAPTV